MPAWAPLNVELEFTAIPIPTLEEAKVPVPTNVTASGVITPVNVPVIVAAFVPS